MSKSVFKAKDLGLLGKLIIRVASLLMLLDVKENVGEDRDCVEINNMTIINLTIKFIGPVHERRLTIYLILIQVRYLISITFVCFV